MSDARAPAAPALTLTRLNNDAAWLLTVDSIRVAIDPWLVGDEIDGCAAFNAASLARAALAPAAVGALDAVLLTQGFSDHTHEATLRLLEGAPAVYAAPGALARARACVGRARARPLAALAADFPGWAAAHVPPPLLEPTHGGVLLATPAGSVLVAPHGLRLAALAPRAVAAALAAAPRPLTVLATTTEYRLPALLGGTVNLGLAAAAALCAAVRADVFHATHDERKRARGCVPRVAVVTYATAAEIAAAIPAARAPALGGAPDAPAPPREPMPAAPRAPPRELPQAAAAAEAPATAAAIAGIAARAPRVARGVDSVRVYKAWDAAARTHTFHTHVFVAGIPPGGRARALLARCAALFLDAYGMERHGWYQQFVGGVPTRCEEAGGGAARAGWGLFDLGVGALRAYHTRFDAVARGDDAAAVVLRTVAAAEAPPRGATQVFLLPPTGDLFVLADGGLHWHHVCTVAGVRLLPGALDGALMTCLRSTGLVTEERGTYAREGATFARFVRGEWDKGGAGAAAGDAPAAAAEVAVGAGSGGATAAVGSELPA